MFTKSLSRLVCTPLAVLVLATALVELHFDSTTYSPRGPTVVVQGR